MRAPSAGTTLPTSGTATFVIGSISGATLSINPVSYAQIFDLNPNSDDESEVGELPSRRFASIREASIAMRREYGVADEADCGKAGEAGPSDPSALEPEAGAGAGAATTAETPRILALRSRTVVFC